MPCDDGLYCTVGDSCEGGVCVGSQRSCQAPGACKLALCSEEEKGCVVQNLPDGTSCDDGLYCTDGDKCVDGACTGVARDCSDQDDCTVDSCNEDFARCENVTQANPGAEGPAADPTCSNGIDDDCDGLTDTQDGDCIECTGPADCNDNNPCTADACTAGLCENTPLSDGTPCDDGLFCTENDACSGGQCGGSAKSCDDSNACTLDLCDEQSDQCVNQQVPLPHVAEVCWDGADQDCDGVADGCCLGDGTFGQKADIAVGSSPYASVAADFNSDGILDLAVASPGDNKVWILLGNGSAGRGDGTFTVSGFHEVGNFPYAIVAEDLDRDGILDLVTANFNGATVSVLVGNGSGGKGDGTFASGVAFSVGSGPNSLVTGDFNEDGLPDLAVANNLSNTVSVLLATSGGGVFQPAQDYDVGMAPQQIIAGDFNSDGITDLAVAHNGDQSSPGITVLLGDGTAGLGDGTFTKANDCCSNAGFYASTLVAGDFDSDGIYDIAAFTFDGMFYVLKGDGNGNFSLLGSGGTGAGDGVTHAVSADFNHDGIFDLAFTNSSSGADTIGVLLGAGQDGRGNGQFSFPPSTYATGQTPWHISKGDFNSDGIVDLVVANSASGSAGNSLSILLGRGSGSVPEGDFLEKTDLSLGAGPRSVAVGDLNADDILDIVVANDSDGTIRILLGEGSGGKGTGTFIDNGHVNLENVVSVALADFDGDAILDIAAVGYLSKKLSIFLGDGANGVGDGSFTPGQTYNFLSGPQDLAVADFDSDGKMDIAVVLYSAASAGTVTMFRGNGDGSFSRGNAYDAGVGATSIAAGDFNEDGLLDVAVANLSDNTVSVLLADGNADPWNGSFLGATNYSVGASPWAVTACDLDGDDILDLVAANASSSSNSVSVLLGNGSDGRGDGTFAQKVDFLAGDGPSDVSCVDIDGNGIPDLAVSDKRSGKLTVLFGTGNRQQLFRDVVEYAVGASPLAVASGDFNSDSVVDLVTANNGSDSISLLIGRRTCLSY
ncbi:MAG: VCBS repeat-containing protein [Deltaproteobacteria bacterium]|nr:MAG: VCBS repeat-containing protein [Deltaproteobacteria bacterium]